MDNFELERYLRSIGKATFAACYDVYAQNYMKEDKSCIEEAVRRYGLSTGYKYQESSVKTKVSAGCTIFKAGKQKEALAICQASRIA